ncbi:MAG: hypothetical protein KAH01_06265 [Caldisericia bacterium]|nr:hypothetical protein [Caldisericia bacterium]
MKKVLQLFLKKREPLQSSSKNTPWAPRTPKRGAPFFFFYSKNTNSRTFVTVFLLLSIIFSFFTVSCSKTNVSIVNPICDEDLKELPTMVWDNLSQDEASYFYDWANPFLKQCFSLGILDKKEVESPSKFISKGRFLILLCNALNCPKTVDREIPFTDVKEKTILYSSIAFSIEKGIVDLPIGKQDLFYPDKPIMRWEAALWLAKAREVNFSFYKENNVYILAQDALKEFPSEKAKISFGFCYLPENQLMQYRWSTKNEYRLCKPYSEMNFCDTAYSIYHILFPPSHTDSLSVAKQGKITNDEIIEIEDFRLLKNYIYTSAIGGRDINWGYYPVLVDRIPNLADGSLKFLDDGRVQCYFKLRDHIQWANGKTVVTEDTIEGFKFAEKYLNTQTPFEWLLGIKCIDANTVVVTWSRGFYGVERAFWLHPSIVCEDMSWDQYYHLALFKIEAIDDQKVKLVQNELYFNGSGITNQIEVDFYEEKLESCDFDIIIIDSFNEPNLKKEENKKEIVFPSMQWEHLDFKMPNSKLLEKKVRQALHEAISLEELNDYVWNSKAFPTDRWFLYTHPANKKANIKSRDKRVSAVALLEQSGWRKKDDSRYVQSNGVFFEIDLIYLKSDIYRENCAKYIKGKWELLGIKVTVIELEEKDFFELLRQKSPNEARVFLYSWVFGEKTDLFSILHSSSIPGAKNSYFGENYSNYKNGDVDILLLKTLKEVNSTKRAKLLNDIQEIVSNDYYTIPLYNVPQDAFIRKDVAGISVPFSGIKLDWNVESWYKYFGG